MTQPITPTAHSSLVGGSTAARRTARDVTPEEVRRFIAYNPATGALTWKERAPSDFTEGGRSTQTRANKWNGRFAGKPAINTFSNGYLTGHLNRVQVYAHRIAWLHFYGESVDPECYVDHVNGDRTDNRIVNLRVVTPRQSAFNAPPRNRKGYPKGVKYDTRRARWYARIRVGGVETSLGGFDSVEAATTAYERAAETHQGAHAFHVSRGIS